MLSPNTVDEEQPKGTLVGTLQAIDPDEDDTFVFKLVEGDGADDNSQFTIDGDQLKTAAMFRFADKSSYTIRVRVTDSVGHTSRKRWR